MTDPTPLNKRSLREAMIAADHDPGAVRDKFLAIGANAVSARMRHVGRKEWTPSDAKALYIISETLLRLGVTEPTPDTHVEHEPKVAGAKELAGIAKAITDLNVTEEPKT